MWQGETPSGPGYNSEKIEKRQLKGGVGEDTDREYFSQTKRETNEKVDSGRRAFALGKRAEKKPDRLCSSRHPAMITRQEGGDQKKVHVHVG